MGDGVNIAARLEGICAPGAICLSEDAYRQVKGRLDFAVTFTADEAAPAGCLRRVLFNDRLGTSIATR